ncbi:hypothetical protein VTH8203_00860 [Vibrio thalassae]|uniref:Uncharacterized protein n=1 Tax=Vibrio thalassae TaxID=1243014 RepID=A0A240EGE7_9VIBR|nr:hypothetical protein [Vibrio thalassae]SNX47259.1 hypothetical protein VTH8203_00860 [Vibrio thalassae]
MLEQIPLGTCELCVAYTNGQRFMVNNHLKLGIFETCDGQQLDIFQKLAWYNTKQFSREIGITLKFGKLLVTEQGDIAVAREDEVVLELLGGHAAVTFDDYLSKVELTGTYSTINEHIEHGRARIVSFPKTVEMDIY